MNTKNDMKCFVVMPFTLKDVDKERYKDPNHWSEVYQGLIEPAVVGAGLLCSRDDGDIGSRLIVEGILKKIEEAHIVLCDLSSHNPNVFLELGWALRADRPFVLIKDELTQFTFDLNQQYTFEYSHRLQPTVLAEQVKKLTEVITRTTTDSEQRYSVVKHLSVNVGAIQAANKGDVQSEMLLDIQRKLESLGRRTTAPIARAFVAGEWPPLVRKGMRLLFGTLEYLQAPDSIAPGSPEFIGRFEAKTREWGARRARDIQVSLISEQRRFVYHDWHELIGSRACFQAQEGGDIYDDVFAYPFGAVVWTDNTTNVPGSPVATGSLQRLNLALFSHEPRLQHRIVVETHQEIP